MGICGSSQVRPYNIPSVKKFQSTFEGLKIEERDIAKLHKQFAACDYDHSGAVSVHEFFRWFKLPETRFSKRVFSLFDDDGSGELDFKEFVVSLWNYCTFDKIALISFAFDLYDLDSGGTIDHEEMNEVLKEVYGGQRAIETNKMARAILGKISRIGDGSGHVSKEDFIKFVKTHPGMMFPAFRLQMELQKRVCGTSFWTSLANKRSKSFGNANVDITWILENVTANGFMKIAEETEIGGGAPGTNPAKGSKKGRLSRSQSMSRVSGRDDDGGDGGGNKKKRRKMRRTKTQNSGVQINSQPGMRGKVGSRRAVGKANRRGRSREDL